MRPLTPISEEEMKEFEDVSEEEETEEFIVVKVEQGDEVEAAEEYEEYEEAPEEDVEGEVQKAEEEKSANPAQPLADESNGSGPHLPMADPPFLLAVSHLEKLHGALSVFLHQWNSLNRSFDSISAAIDAQGQQRSPVPVWVKNERRELQVICEKMGGKALRNYVISNLSNINRLRRELLEALRSFQNPEKVVLDAMGRFYTQDSRSYKNNEPLVSFRRACILLLESYVLSGRAAKDSSVKEAAKSVALAWNKRLINDNSFGNTLVMDSVGLILFLACYGIPEEIGFRELCNLLRQANLKKKANVFRHSNILVEKIPGVIKELIRADMLVDAAELSCAFGLEDNFPPLPLLSSFVAKVMQIGKEEPQRVGYMRQLASLESVTKCLEDYKLDANQLGSVPIYEEIAKLKEQIALSKMGSRERRLKRKMDEADAYKKSKKRSKKPLPSNAEESCSALKAKPEHGCTSKPQVTDSSNVNFHASFDDASRLAAREAALSGTATTRMVNKGQRYPYGLSGTYHPTSASIGCLGLAHPAIDVFNVLQPARAQNFHRPHNSYGNAISSLGQNLYRFADTVIQRELNHEHQ